jgi:hypothetical protein
MIIKFGSDDDSLTKSQLLQVKEIVRNQPPERLSAGQIRDAQGILGKQVLKWASAFGAVFAIAIGTSLYSLFVSVHSKTESHLIKQVATQFEEPRIRQILEDVATNQAALVIQSQINPQVAEFREKLESKLSGFQEKITTDLAAITDIRNRIQDQASAISSITEESAKAKDSIAALQKSIMEAEETLREIKRITDSMIRFPDGRLVMGGMLTGRATVLFEAVERLNRLTIEDKWQEAYDVASNAIRIYEESKELEKQVSGHFSDVFLKPEGVSQIYWQGAQSALKTAKNGQGLEWAKKADALSPSPKSTIILINALAIGGYKEEAAKLAEQILSKNDETTELLKAYFGQSNSQKSE